jgi:hypothetical protein
VSAIYHPMAFSALVSHSLQSVSNWVQSNPGKSIEECATALSVPYEVVFEVCREMGLVVKTSSRSVKP